MIHGDHDVCQHVERGRAFAEITGGELVVIEGAGHLALPATRCGSTARSKDSSIGYRG